LFRNAGVACHYRLHADRAVPALQVSDTIKSVDANDIVTKTYDRVAAWRQTPQAFAYPALLDAHRRAAKEGHEDFSDDAALAEWAGQSCSFP
jgi:2-C-methyl-D-erythritol 4-phosphate cytidylyltransferase/2-C-methyl-D-erythritol 2,4-cyclodiphosphate synthase